MAEMGQLHRSLVGCTSHTLALRTSLPPSECIATSGSRMTGLHHIGYWVDDLDMAVERAIRTLGIGPFLVHRHVAFDAFRMADGTAITDPAYFDHSAAFAAWGPVVLELAEVHTVDPGSPRPTGSAPTGSATSAGWSTTSRPRAPGWRQPAAG